MSDIDPTAVWEELNLLLLVENAELNKQLAAAQARMRELEAEYTVVARVRNEAIRDNNTQRRRAEKAEQRVRELEAQQSVFGPEKQAHPGGPVYRTGVSTDAVAVEQPSAEPVSRTYSCGCVLCICDDEEKCHGCGAKSCGKPDAGCGYKQDRIRAVLNAEHPTLAAAVAPESGEA